ncbi:MAG TPA: HAD-IC family P-type ATPase [Pelomicrobium sp.]|nr:HAD-IC family P-type ATPase [Pelomicrobium sp.]
MTGGAPAPERMADTAWHALDGDEALARLDSRREGLDDEEARERRRRYGPNRLPEEQRDTLIAVFLRQFKDPLIYILLIAGIVSLAIGNLNNAIFILAVLLVNSVIGTYQEWKAESSAAALKEVMRVGARVTRAGRERDIDSTELVPGDIVRVEAGDKVTADLRLLSSRDLSADESLLTGESTPVRKRHEADVDEDAALGDRATLLHAGTVVMDGRARGVVCRTGAATEVGRIASSLAEREAQAPPLVIKLRRFTRQIGIIILVAIALLSAVQLWQGTALVQIFFLGVALAVSAIPAGLPVAITVAFSIAANRMAARHVIVRLLPAVEGLGSCTLVASDKTGTLTANVLTVKRIQLADGAGFEVEGEGYEAEGGLEPADGEAGDAGSEAIEALAVTGALCNEGSFRVRDDGEPEHAGDSVDVAFLVLAHKLGLERDELLREHEEVDAIPFKAERRFAASIHRAGDRTVAHVKGAAEVIVGMCDGVDADEIGRREEKLAEAGYRVLALARGEVPARDDYGADDMRGLRFLGLVGLIDPIREEVPDAVRRCRSAGVEVRMITGDHPRTGLAIARQLGIAGDDDEAATGRDLQELEDDEERLDDLIRRAPVFARVEPTQKTVIIERLQRQGHFVAVTGDGVNDAPALKAAHVGVAMGESGTDVARGAASLILTDDNFASIVNGIEEGRVAYDNVRKVTWLLLATGAAEVLLFFLALFTGLPLPLTAVQLLWLNLVTNGIQDVALAFEKAEPGVLERRPRSPTQPVFDRQMIRQTALSGGYIGLVAFGVYWFLLERMGLGEFEARNLLLLLMVLFENAHVFSCRSETRSLFRMPLRANPLVVGAVIVAQGVHIAAMYTPGLSAVLETQPVSLASWGILAALAATLLLFDELMKLAHRHQGTPRAAPA